MYKTEQNTRATERKVRSAFNRQWYGKRGGFETVYEHGQWWIVIHCANNERLIYAVVDANTHSGLDFEAMA